jgi:hypothetical protein
MVVVRWVDTSGRFDKSGGVMSASVASVQVTDLSEEQRAILTFERQWWRYEGSKEQAITKLFDLDMTTYYQTLSNLIDQDTALAFDPQLVKRLRRLRQARQRHRSARRLA